MKFVKYVQLFVKNVVPSAANMTLIIASNVQLSVKTAQMNAERLQLNFQCELQKMFRYSKILVLNSSFILSKSCLGFLQL